ncbi:MAG TPA: ATP-binding protein [Bacillota bacterium]|nr:ATP-binding protein [Bacillota bacterium]
MRSFSFRLNVVIISILVVTLLGMGIYVAGLIQKVYTETLSNRLTKEAALVSTFIQTEQNVTHLPELQSMIQQFAQAEDSRITIIEKSGKVLADSEADPSKMENHSDRPEVIEAMHNQEGHAVRFSHTLNQEMVYVAHVFTDPNGNIKGVVRVALSTSQIEKFIHKLWLSLVMGLFATLLINAIVGLFVSRHITKPIAEITSVARKITEKNYGSRVKGKMVGEIGQLSSAINFMAASLESQMFEIEENQEKLSRVLNNMVSGVILIGESRRILLANSAIEDLLGYSEKELIGKLHIEAGLNYGLSQLIDRCFQTGGQIREEVHMYYPKERIIDCNLAPYTTERGEVKGVVTVLHDISAIRRLEKMRSEFVANVSHELRTPITSIKGFAETLLDGAAEDKEVLHNFLEIIFNESERLNRLVNDILDLSRIEQKKVPLHLELINLYDLVKEISYNLIEKINRKNIEMELPEELPIVLEADRDRLHQVIVNLVDNAISYTPDGGKVSINIIETGEKIQLEVKDTGLGIPLKDRERIFERFYRVDKGRSRESGGTGLGLAIVKHLVESHHGKIEVESAEGKGSTFRVSLPKRLSL